MRVPLVAMNLVGLTTSPRATVPSVCKMVSLALSNDVGNLPVCLIMTYLFKPEPDFREPGQTQNILTCV